MVKPNLVDFSILERDVSIGFKNTFNSRINVILLLLFIITIGFIFYISKKKYTKEEEEMQTLEQLNYILSKSEEYSMDSKNYINYSPI